MSWRDNIGGDLREHLEAQIGEASKQKHAYRYSKNQSNAQLWCAIANISRQLFNLNLKLNYLERALKEGLLRLNEQIACKNVVKKKAINKKKPSVKKGKKRAKKRKTKRL